MRRVAVGAWALLFSSWFAGQAHAQVAVVVRSAADRELSLQLGSLLEASVHEVAADSAAAEGYRYVVRFERGQGAVHVERRADDTTLSRSLGADVMRDSPYAVALATAELLEWLGMRPLARGRPSGQAGGAASPAALRAGGSHAASLDFALGVGLELVTSPGFDLNLARPALLAELQLGRASERFWLACGLRIAGPASWQRSLEPQLFDSAASNVRYSDTEAALHAAFGVALGHAGLVPDLQLGLSWIDVEARSRDQAVAGDHSARALWFGGGLGVRVPLAAALTLSATVQLRWFAERLRYRLEGRPVFEEGPLRIATGLGLMWENGLLR